MRLFTGVRGSLFSAVALGAMVIAIPASAQEARQEYNIESQDLGEALRIVSRQSGQEIVFAGEAVAGKRSKSLHGNFSAEEAVHTLIAGTDLVADFREDGILIRGRSASSGQVTDGSAATGEILVTGSRIRGGVQASPVIVMTQDEIEKAGFANLGDVIRSIPQNFSGGQNPTVAGGGIQGAANQNTTSSSALNLRGLGPDATLTLLNGHRMPYDGVFQGVDISSIPLAAIDRIEIVTDGASAIYGSDAVAGVANVRLKRSFNGLESAIRYGASTDSGNEQVQASAVGGATWKSGGILGTFDFSRQTAILAGDRPYLRGMEPEQTLVPALRQYSGIIAGYQEVSPSVRVEFDGTYNRRKSRAQTPNSNTANYLKSGGVTKLDVESFSISPSVRADFAPTWDAYVMGTYAESRAHIRSQLFSNSAIILEVPVDYTNTLKSVEGGVSGSITTLPGGALKLAAGGGYRSNVLDGLARQISPTLQRTTLDFTEGRDSWYGFGELNAPVIGPQNGVPFVNQFALSAAARYENYPGLASVFTPKLGAVYSPVPPLFLKASWGRSFKSPTLYQQFQPKSATLRNITAYGTTSFPAGSTVIGLSGGNPDTLSPERAETLTLSGELRPPSIPGARIEASYFRTKYRDRIISPIPSNLGLFSNPIYAGLITTAPTADQIAAAIAGAPAGLVATGIVYDPTKVVAIVDNRQRNSSRQEIEGIDLSVRYGFPLGTGRLTLLGDGSYLLSEQILIAGQSSRQLAGTIYNPPHWRARGGLLWDSSALSATAYVNFIGGNIDQRITPERPVASYTTVDLAVTYRVEHGKSVLDGLQVSLSAINVLNQGASLIRQSLTIEPAYDSTNYSPVGRFVSLSVRKMW